MDVYIGGISTTASFSPACLGNRIPLSSCNTTLDVFPRIPRLYNPPIGVLADDDDICINEGLCVVVGIKPVASSCFIEGGASGPPDEVGWLLLCSCPEFCDAAEGFGKGSMGEEGRTGECSTLVSDGDLRTHTPRFRRDVRNHIKPTTTKATTAKKPTTPPTIGPIMTVDPPLALLELADVVNVPEAPELDAGGLELDAGVLGLDAMDVVAGDEAPAVVADPVGRSLNVTPYEKTSEESE